MNKTTAIAALLAATFAGAAFAQSVAPMVERNLNQQRRIEQGLQSGALSTREAAKLEREEGKINRMQSRALNDGQVSAQEQARIKAAQDQASRDIYRQRHDAQTGNPASASSQRMQAAVQRNANQQARVLDGVKSGQLTTGEAAALERGQARVERNQARAGG